MTVPQDFYVALFKSVSYAMKAEKILKQENIRNKLIPVPKHISSDCGVCLRFGPEDAPRVAEALQGKVEVEEIRPL
ncbi:MAG: DUF3343 domain-containing protein [bacterium]|nr:DUF3343 domain-containing protein [bacterium]